MRLKKMLFLILAWAVACVSPAVAQEPVPIVRGVLFWMSTCPHCHEVLTNVLPPLQEEYGPQLQLLLVEVKSQEDFERLYQVGEAYSLPPDQLGVPFLVIGDHALVGSLEIAEQLPGLIETYLAAGGVGYPDVPALAPVLPKVLAPLPPATTAERATQPAVAEAAASPAPIEPIAAAPPIAEAPLVVEQLPATDPATPGGFALAFGVLIGMGLATVYAAFRLLRGRRQAGEPPNWLLMLAPLLALVGLSVAAYLAYVETQAATAVCGPVGDCNAVQQSPYARIAGVPIGLIGVIGYTLILAVWLWGRRGDDRAWTVLLGLTAIGVVFSIYLTYLELFVIQAVCLWCLSSAIISTLLFLAAVEIFVSRSGRQSGRISASSVS